MHVHEEAKTHGDELELDRAKFHSPMLHSRRPRAHREHEQPKTHARRSRAGQGRAGQSGLERNVHQGGAKERKKDRKE